tara:strand:- start:312 stop:1124 length:813 start_codon:yes stop_codon:yes gene_type:complete
LILIKNKAELSKYLPRSQLAFVPTMGNLHEGHIALIKHAQKYNSPTICSIFVNKLQFGPNEDFDKYPRTLNQDIDLLEKNHCDFLFIPDEEHFKEIKLYKADRALSKILCGAIRPTHFDGVVSVLHWLVKLIHPTYLLMGQKDFQQIKIVERFMAEHFAQVQLIEVPTEREADGVAKSSRNNLLTSTQRKLAPRLYQVLLNATSMIENKNIDEITKFVNDELNQAGFDVDYVEIKSRLNLLDHNPSMSDAILLCAARLGEVRLIDNIFIK